jgi:hypothetical protein
MNTAENAFSRELAIGYETVPWYINHHQLTSPSSWIVHQRYY